jgi:glycosyltransferase involved in cell wall biosynthesis
VKRRSAVDVAVYAPFAGSLYRAGRSSGGAEVQSMYLVRALDDQGLRARHIVAFPDGSRPSDLGIDVLEIPSGYFSGGVSRRLAIAQAIRAANARVYIQRSASFETGVVGAVARATGRRFIFSSSSVVDFMLDAQTRRTAGAGLESSLACRQYRVGLRLANSIVVQTQEQRELAKRDFEIAATVIRSFAEPAEEPAHGERSGFLWIGALAEVKDPLSFVALARAVPEAPFTMVGSERVGSEALAEEVSAEAAATPNLSLVDSPGRSRVLEAYATALAVVNTSQFEGFPNTFLEAWARGTPVLSLRRDPDGIIERHNLGAFGHGSIEQLASEARALLGSPPGDEWSTALRDYVRSHHDPAVVGEHWADLVRRLL